MITTLYITTRGGLDGAESFENDFPYLPGQLVDGESPLDNDRVLVEIRLDDQADITPKQQDYLDASPYVIEYEIERRTPPPRSPAP
jgi:hypothetical protein